ncbi:MAG TPA: hypothetical protein VE404_06085, partial [Verrucomicrobiae bacterium]|nr:hypothetical protein [Verrucomicrobiae bacterium]
KEVASDRTYHAVLSREEVPDVAARYKYGVTIIRLKDYHDSLKFTTDDPEKIPAEFAVQTIIARGAKPLYLGHERSLGGIWYHEFNVPIGWDDAGTCVQLTLLINLRGNEWLEAMWEVPCPEAKALHKELKTITESLRVSRRWGLGT